MRRLVCFTEHYYPDESTASLYLTSIINRATPGLPLDVHVICSSANPDSEPDDFVQRVTRFSSGRFDKNRLLSRALKFAIITSKFAWRGFGTVRRGDAVFSVTNPAFIVLSLALFRKFRRFDFTLLVHDVFPENLVVSGVVRRNSLSYRLALRVFNWAYGCADHLIVLGRDMQQVVDGKVGGQVPCTVIPSWGDTEKIRPTPKCDSEILQRCGWQDRKVFLFAGNIGPLQGIPHILEAAQRVKSDDAAFLFIGGGGQREYLERFIEDDERGNVKYLGQMPASEQQDFLNACDVALVSLGDGMFGLGVPSKSYFNMAAGKPILFVGDSNSEIALVVAEHDVGWQVPAGDPQALADLVDRICGEGDLRAVGERSRAVGEKHFSEKAVLAQYTEHFRRVLDLPAAVPGESADDVIPGPGPGPGPGGPTR